MIWLATDAIEFGTRFFVSYTNYSLLKVLKLKKKKKTILVLNMSSVCRLLLFLVVILASRIQTSLSGETLSSLRGIDTRLGS